MYRILNGANSATKVVLRKKKAPLVRGAVKNLFDF